MPQRAMEHIVVEGPIGVGKTSLARRLARSLEAELLVEHAEENPFLERFYREQRGVALPTQLFFLLQRVEQLRGLRQSDLFRPRLVSDFLFDKDWLFAELNLDHTELELYQRVYRALSVEVPRPDLVVYLQAPVEVLRERIRGRGIRYEQAIAASYLERLVEAYVEFFYHWEESPLLIVNTAGINPIDNDAELALLVERIRELPSGRHYFNPAPVSL